MTGESSVLRIEGFETLQPQDKEPSPMSQKPISELRRRMLEDMAVRKFQRSNYPELYPPHRGTCQVPRTFSRHGNCGRRTPFPGAHDREPPKLNSATSAIRFFFGTTLDRPEL